MYSIRIAYYKLIKHISETRKMLFWGNSFSLCSTSLVIGLFFVSGVHLFSLGIFGEHVGSVLTHVKQRPLVFEAERINFDD